MVLNYFGDGCFRLQSGELSLLVNPQNNRLKGDVVLKTLSLASEPVLADEVAFPGEYEMKGIQIQGWPLENESSPKILKTIYMVTWEEMHFLFLGHLSGPLPAAFLEELEIPDVVFVPTGDEHFIDAEAAWKLVKQLEPKIIVPAYYLPAGRQARIADAFLKASGLKPEPQDKFVFRRKDLGEEAKARIVLIEAKS